MPDVPRLKELVVGFSQQGLGFDNRLAHVGFVVDNAALRRIFFTILRLPPSILFH